MNPKQKKRFKELTSSGLFKLKCGSGSEGRACRRKKADLLHKISEKVAGRSKRSKRRRRSRLRRRKDDEKQTCKKCARHLQKFKTFNDRYKKWYKNYYQTWYQHRVSGPMYKRILDNRYDERDEMRQKLQRYKQRNAIKRLKQTENERNDALG